jgi:hypothetical protein
MRNSSSPMFKGGRQPESLFILKNYSAKRMRTRENIYQTQKNSLWVRIYFFMNEFKKEKNIVKKKKKAEGEETSGNLNFRMETSNP